ncbi:unnamed protein product [Adineta ricciae]|uniref:WWE domain-containing protein n=1 Tax=Adineta ricciae TaxID=249248 RepID=A0A813WQI1_ADIRI|nr:unnamed protein product [Adineta ricciae]CAF1147670.1 unnamed protein product [Adineta ricciae]
MTKENSVTSSAKWLWKTNKNDLWYFPEEGVIESDNWTPYSDNEAAQIEASYQKKEKAAIFNDYRIDLSLFMHISNWNDKRERLVKRTSFETEPQANPGTQQPNQRLQSIPLLPLKSFGRWRDNYIDCILNDVWNYFHVNSSALQELNTLRRMVVAAAKGLEIEGDRQGKEAADELLSVKDGTLEQVTVKCAALYTRATFLSGKLNEFMRFDGEKEKPKFVKEKMKTLGPFALLLSEFPENGSETKITVYRSLCINEDMIEQYRESEQGRDDFVFPAFTSTSRNLSIAKLFGDRIILEIDIIPRYDAIDISPYSNFPEEEMLLRPYFTFRIQSCMYDNVSKKWIIHLQSISIDDEL